jgi:hypothetical protein
MTAERLVGLLAEPERRRVAAAMILGAVELDDIVRTTGLDTRSVVDALHRFHDAGLAESGPDGTWVLIESVFKLAARAAAPDETAGAHADEPDEIRRVLDLAFRDGRLVQWPSKRSRRLVVLDRLAQRFEPGVRYTEREVNARLRPVGDDTATMRRYLVDERFLDRADGEYWRSGGSV